MTVQAAHDEPAVPSETLVQLHALCADYWARLDRTNNRPVAALYTDDGAMTLGPLQVCGRDALEAFFADRNTSEIAAGRQTRHLFSNLVATARQDGGVDLQTLVLVFAGLGEPPLASGPPVTIADFFDVCRQDAQGRWRFESRLAKAVFTGPGAASFAR